jgi:hypothetical protein
MAGVFQKASGHSWSGIYAGRHRRKFAGGQAFEKSVLTDHPEASPGQVLRSTRVVLQEDPEVFTLDTGLEPQG